jgi:DNA repair protein RadC
LPISALHAKKSRWGIATIRITQDLIEAARHMKIQVHDHVIIGASGHTSMRAMGLI